MPQVDHQGDGVDVPQDPVSTPPEKIYHEINLQSERLRSGLVDSIAKRQLREFNGNPKPLLIRGKMPLDAFDGDHRRINYIDSSIWCRYTEEGSAEEVIRKMERYHALGLYENVHAQELLDFNARLVQQSYIKDFPNGRSEQIVPFVFHSEGRVANAVQAVKERMKTIRATSNLKWRVMLVDDGVNHKADIVCAILSEDFSVTCNGLDISKGLKPDQTMGEVELVCVPIDRLLDRPKSAIFKQRFDMVLLDYAFPNKDGSVRYSYDLLTAISNAVNGKDDASRKKWAKRRGIFGKFWFFHISPFAVAIEEKLQEKGFSHHTEDWHIGRGACPVVTPELFRYNLTRFMLRQVEIITRLPLHNEEHPDYIITLVDLLDKIFAAGNTRDNAARYFNVLLELRARYRMLKKDLMVVTKEEANQSPLVASLFPDLRVYSNSFWEHMVHLVYVIAYGTIRQWPDMWEELLFVKPILDEGEQKAGRKNVTQLSECIEGYIIQLKEGGN